MHSMANSQKLQYIFIPALVAMLTIGLSPGFGLSATHQIYPAADAGVDSLFPNVNLGNITSFRVYLAEGYPSTLYGSAFLKFDLSSVPATEKITGAILWTHCDLMNGNPTVQLRHVSNTTWSETGITWNNKPPYGDLIVATVVSVGWKPWDIPVADLPETGLVSFALMTETYGSAGFNSKEYSSGRPFLEVTTTPKPQSRPVPYLLLLD
jgi:hypothetical protein